jgi:hypothetical protein
MVQAIGNQLPHGQADGWVSQYILCKFTGEGTAREVTLVKSSELRIDSTGRNRHSLNTPKAVTLVFSSSIFAPLANAMKEWVIKRYKAN